MPYENLSGSPNVEFRYPRPAPFERRARQSGRFAAWFAQVSVALILLGVGYLVIEIKEEPIERAPLADGIYSGFPEVESAAMIHFGNIPVRLEGIDAPDRNQTCITQSNIEWDCGETAAGVLADLISKGPVTCEGIVGEDGNLIFAVCRDSAGTNINAFLVELGWAVAVENGSRAYGELEMVARREQRGLWATRFEMPKDWRLRQHGEE